MKLRLVLCLILPTLVLAACVTDTIESRRTGQLLVCHKQNKTITVSNANSFVHMDHGDSPGPCPEEETQD